MKDIKSLADELRESIKLQDSQNLQEKKMRVESPKLIESVSIGDLIAIDAIPVDIELFFQNINGFELGGEKLLIRLDLRSANLLKQLKLARGIDMNRFIAFSLQSFLADNLWLTTYIKETLKNTNI